MWKQEAQPLLLDYNRPYLMLLVVKQVKLINHIILLVYLKGPDYHYPILSFI
jgi:hypothetical protein